MYFKPIGAALLDWNTFLHLTGDEWQKRLDLILQGSTDGWLVEQIRNENYTLQLGNKRYELSNHLGNVLAVVSDKKVQSDGAVWSAVVVSVQDYYPFGMSMPGRSSGSYRYTFNGKETDPETGIQDYGMRWYLPNLGRFLSVDPMAQTYPWYTSYQFAGNMPIQAIDLDGAEEWKVTWSPVPIRGPYANQYSAEQSIWSPLTLRPKITQISYLQTEKPISQTGYDKCCSGMTPVKEIKITIGGETYSVYVMHGGMDKDTDGNNTPEEARSSSHYPALSTGENYDATTLRFGTIPSVLQKDYKIPLNSLQIVVGNNSKGQALAIPMITLDNSGGHGGEASICVVWSFGHGNSKKPLPNSSFPRAGQFEYWYFSDFQMKPNNDKIDKNPNTALAMKLRFIAQAAIEAYENHQPIPDNIPVKETNCDDN